MESKGWRWVGQDQLAQITDPIQVFVRDPRQRFFSGVNTFVQHLQDNDLDTHTVLYFINQYLFLNRHYAPQFFWLLHLAQHVPNVRVKLSDITAITQLTNRYSNGEVKPLTMELETRIKSFDWSKMELYFYLDDILLDYRGQTVTVADLITDVQTEHKQLYDLIFKPTLDLVNVLPKT